MGAESPSPLRPGPLEDILGFALLLAAFALALTAHTRTRVLRDALARAEARIRALELKLAEPLSPPPGIEAEAAPKPALASIARPSEVAAPPVPPAPLKPPGHSGPSLFARLERAIASNWFVWIGAAFIALAIVLVLRVAIEQAWFGPPMQLAAAYCLGVWLYAAAEWTRRLEPDDTWRTTQLRRLPAILAAAALFAFFAAAYAGFATFEILPVSIAFVLMAVTSLAAVMLALRYGPWLAALGLGGGYLAPLLVRFEHVLPAALFGYVLALTAAALAVIRIRKWTGFVWLASGGALFWGLAWLQALQPPFAILVRDSAAFYLVALAALGAAFAWSEADAPLTIAPRARWRLNWTESVFAAHALALAAAIVLLVMLHQRVTPMVAAAMVCLCALATLAAAMRESFALAPLGLGLFGAAMIFLWGPGPPDLRAAGALGFIFSAGGWLVMARNRAPALGALLAALGPIAIVVATHHSGGGLRPPIVWSAAALMLAAINVFALERMARAPGGLERAPGPAAAFALGGAASIVFAIVFILGERYLWLAAALGVLVPAMAHLDLRFRLPALRLAISALAAFISARLILGFDAILSPISRFPILNELLPAYAIPAIAFWIAAAFYRRADTAPRLAAALEAGAIVIGAAGASLQIRHLATGGNLAAPYVELGEMGGHAIVWLALALGVATRFGARSRRVLFVTELAAAAAAGGLVLLLGGMLINPWWGGKPSLAPGWPIFNALLAGYGVPGALLALYAVVKGRQGMAWRASAAGAAAAAIFFLNATLEVRRSFHGADMSYGPVAPLEAWTYTAVWVAYAGLLLGLGLLRNKPTLRYASLAVLIAAIIKAFGFDLSAQDGLLRAASYLGLGAAIIAVALIYQRYVFPRGLAKADPGPPA